LFACELKAWAPRRKSTRRIWRHFKEHP